MAGNWDPSDLEALRSATEAGNPHGVYSLAAAYATGEFGKVEILMMVPARTPGLRNKGVQSRSTKPD